MFKPVRVTYGTDPEGFFQREGGRGEPPRIIGSERLIPEKGLGSGWGPDVIRDGIQFELNPPAVYDLPNLGRNLTQAFTNIRELLKNVPGVSINFNGVVEVEREELDALSEKSRILGCMPSKNAYGDRPINVDVKTYRKRSAGGHIHLGLMETGLFYGDVDYRHRLVPHLDIFVGTVGVLIDRDPGAAERRENYGRAGEYRTPDHGLEYRTLSNFWLKNYALMDLMFGMAHTAVAVLSQTVAGEDSLQAELEDTVDIGNVIRAIDTNDYDLARKNYLAIVPFLAKNLPKTGFPLTPDTLQKLLVFTDAVNEEGLDKFFPVDPLTHWTTGVQQSFQSFIAEI